jgi:microcystin-dependent protein
MRMIHSRGAWLGLIGAVLLSGAVAAQEELYIGQIKTVGETFCPRGYQEADGSLLPVSSNTALFSLIGCQYGGDCRNTFAVPDLRGRTMISLGQGPGLPVYQQGQTGGTTTTTMTTATLPAHRHNMMASTNAPSVSSPGGAIMPTYQDAAAEIYSDQAPGSATLNALSVGNAGGSVPFSITQPTLVLRMCIATVGIYPPRN